MFRRFLLRLRFGLIAVLTVVGLTLMILWLSLCSTRTLIGGWMQLRNVGELDCRDLTVRTTWGLSRLEDPHYLDLRGSPLSLRQMERLRERFPACEFRWDVPVSGTRFDSRSLSVELKELTEKDLPAFSFLTELQEVDARECGDCAALLALEKQRPDLRVWWYVPLGGERFSRESESITLSAEDARYPELMERLAYLPALKSLRIEGAALTEQQGTALAEQYPSLELDWERELVCGLFFSNRTEDFSLGGYGGYSPEELKERLARFPLAKSIDLTGCGFSSEELCEFRRSMGDVEIRWHFRLGGVSVCSEDTEIDLSNCPVTVEEVESALPCFSRLEKVVMCDCGISDEEMDALDRRHEDIRFVWMVHFGAFFLRTDATTFIATTFPYGYTYLSNEQLKPLSYCRDLIALDLGHMEYSDTSFLRELTKLQYLILADTRVSDISMLADMKDLRYLELFLTNVKDISPLQSCKNLKHLNLAYCRIEHPELLAGMPWLERLWIPGVSLAGPAEIALRDNLKNTKIERFCESSTGGSWRTDAAYYEMRDVFGVYYMPG